MGIVGETSVDAPLSQLLQPPLVVSGLEAIGNYQHTTHTNEEMDVPLGSQPKKELTSASYY